MIRLIDIYCIKKLKKCRISRKLVVPFIVHYFIYVELIFYRNFFHFTSFSPNYSNFFIRNTNFFCLIDLINNKKELASNKDASILLGHFIRKSVEYHSKLQLALVTLKGQIQLSVLNLLYVDQLAFL